MPWRGNDEGSWELYLATDNYDDAPKTRADDRLSEGTRAPVTGFGFPFVGKSIEQCAEWLKSTPSDVALNRVYFTALTMHSKDDDTVLMCRKEEGAESQYFPFKTFDAVVEIATANGIRFDEHLQGYQRGRMQDGKPDRSKGQPYSGQADH